jgi:hypothetical protein
MNKATVREYYLLALIDFRNGLSVQEMNKTLKMFEDLEDYEACAGILKAIKEIEYDNRED